MRCFFVREAVWQGIHIDTTLCHENRLSETIVRQGCSNFSSAEDSQLVLHKPANFCSSRIVSVPFDQSSYVRE